MKLTSKMIFVALFAWLLTPCAEGGVFIIGGLSRENKVKPGQNYKGSILTENDDAKPQEIKIYQTNYNLSV